MTRSRSSALQLRRLSIEEYAALAPQMRLSVCQTPQWLSFLAASQSAEPLAAELVRDGQRLGLFCGALVRRAGLRILGSPLRGWTTSYMGFSWPGAAPGADAADALAALRRFAFGKLRCAHLELLDRRIAAADYAAQGFTGRLLGSYEIDLTAEEAQLLARMTPACRRCIRRFDKLGCTVEVVASDDAAEFAADYCAQLGDVFARQGLRPPYGQRRVEQLIEALQREGLLLLLRARDAEGRSIGASIFPGCGGSMYFWGGASWEQHRHNRPNEAMMWRAMLEWKARGALRFDMGGGGAYKAKYGGAPISVPWMRRSRDPLVAVARSLAERALLLRRQLSPPTRIGGKG